MMLKDENKFYGKIILTLFIYGFLLSKMTDQVISNGEGIEGYLWSWAGLSIILVLSSFARIETKVFKLVLARDRYRIYFRIIGVIGLMLFLKFYLNTI